MGLKTWITGLFISASLSGQAQEAQPSDPKSDKDNKEVKSPVINGFSVEEANQSSVELRKQRVLTLKNTLQRLDDKFGNQGSKISSNNKIRQAAQQDLSLDLPKPEVNSFYEDAQQIIKEEIDGFQQRVNKRIDELHTKYGNYIAEAPSDLAESPSDQGPFKVKSFSTQLSLKYDGTKGGIVIDWKPVRKNLTPFGKALKKKSGKFTEY